MAELIIGWFLIGAILVVLFIGFKFKEARHKIGLISSLFLLMFFLISFGQVYLTNDLDLSNFDGLVEAGKLYFSWLGSFANNVVKVTSYVVQQDWVGNSTAP